MSRDKRSDACQKRYLAAVDFPNSYSSSNRAVTALRGIFLDLHCLALVNSEDRFTQ